MIIQFQNFLRWLMFLWVKVEVFPRENPPYELDPNKPTLYVLADRGLSDLLVLTQITGEMKLQDPRQPVPIEEISAYRSVYNIASSNPMFGWLRRRKKQSPLLQDFLQALEQEEKFDLQIVPVSVYWGRPLAKQKHWLQVLFADTWAVAGRTRKLITLLIHGRNTRLIFSQPLEFQTLAEDCNYSPEALHEFLLSQLTRQREATFGPEITSLKKLTNEVLKSDYVKKTIDEVAGNQKRAIKKAKSRARRYCREIFADCTQLTIEVMLRLLRFFWGRYYAGIDTYNIDRVKQTALTHQLVYVPCHRSHVDYLLLSFVIYQENLAIPYIAAGNNLDVPFIGRILRGGGAFFIRRSFKDSPVYSAVIRSYVEQLIALGVPLGYFIEGGRSRTGRMLKPKIGMLNMTVDAFIRTQCRPLAFVPVYIGYEKLMEGKSYLREMYGGKKLGESLFGIIRAIFKLSGNFGKVTASFGKPIDLAELLDQQKSDWPERVAEIDQRPDWYRATVSKLSQQIMYEINRACVISPINLIATIMIATPRQSIDLQELIQQGQFLSRLIESVPALESLRLTETLDQAQIEHLAQQKFLHIRDHPFGKIAYLKPDDSVLMGYYRNNSLHALIIPALIACCFVNTRQMTLAKLVQIAHFLYPFLQSELQLEWEEKDLEALIEQFVSVFVKEGVLIQAKNTLRRPDRSGRCYMFLNRLALIVQPILERYYMTFIVLWQSSESPMREPELEQYCHLLAQKISMLHGINAPDFFDRLLFRNFLETMSRLDYLKKDAQGALVFSDSFKHVNPDIRKLLNIEIRSTILTLITRANST
ncbi:MAG: glycerol-3-phosphate 1-O-acyltransferase PlsB [Proteobacteria bacterium]|nr:glycerol-3-phosphate 1-O-acyltransferase PlsB [Pseudomonadota bacterium]